MRSEGNIPESTAERHGLQRTAILDAAIYDRMRHVATLSTISKDEMNLYPVSVFCVLAVVLSTYETVFLLTSYI